jgi:hypothetical protein
MKTLFSLQIISKESAAGLRALIKHIQSKLNYYSLANFNQHYGATKE